MNQRPVVISKKALWAGYTMTALPVLLLLASGATKLIKPDPVVKGFVQYGFPEGQMIPLGILEITCTVLYVIPRTSVLGAILLTGYLGGATAANVRIGQNYLVPVIVGVLVWGGLFMRDARLRELIPMKRRPAK
jgi:hypothetical protein